MLRYLDDWGDVMLPLNRKAIQERLYRTRYLNFEDYFPSQVERTVDKLVRKGWVNKEKTADGLLVTLTVSGQKQVLQYKLEDFRPKTGKWDGKWRVVLFDVEEWEKRKRDTLRKYLKRLGFWEMQKSVYICPFDCDKEVKYLREVLEIPRGVKLGTMETIENGEDLKEMFGLG